MTITQGGAKIMTKQRVLVTGMSGLIGGLVRDRLADQYELTALNRSEVPGAKTFQADLSDLAAIQPAFVGQDVVIHMAAKAGNHYTWQDLEQTNNVGTYNVFEAARQAGVKRVVYASSGATISGWEQEEPYKALAEGRYQDVPDSWPMITHESPVRPTGIYGCTKVWGEALARHFTDSTDLSIICLRIGVVNRQNRPNSPRDFAIWCSHADIAQMVEHCVAAPANLKFDIFFVVSDNKWGYRDISHGREVVGYEPQDAAEAYR
jgi:nucleoside-diphosphate-sugar epimerase